MGIFIGPGINMGSGITLTGGPLVPSSGQVLWLDPSNVSSGYNTSTNIIDISPAAIGSQSWSNGSGTVPPWTNANGGIWTTNPTYQQYINIGPYRDTAGFSSLTMCAWVNMANVSTTSTIMGKEGAYKMTHKSGGPTVLLATSFGSWALNTQFSTPLTVGTWYMLTVTVNSSNVLGYVNAAQTFTSSGLTLTTGGSGTELDIAAYNSGGSNHAEFFNGSLGAVMMWNRALTSVEVSSVFAYYQTQYGV